LGKALSDAYANATLSDGSTGNLAFTIHTSG
jgi:hypothetical protein